MTFTVLAFLLLACAVGWVVGVATAIHHNTDLYR